MKDDAPKNSTADDSTTFKVPAGTPLKPAGNISVRHEEKLPEATEVKLIHPRRPLPATPESVSSDLPRDRDE
jgi:hypothetical protein